jgi:hypothetical protein
VGRRLALVATALLAPVAVSGCSSGQRGADPHASVLQVTERDFRIAAPAVVHSGEVHVAVHNEGPDTHELIFVRAPAGGRLPLRPDGLTVDEDAVEKSTLGSVDGEQPGTHHQLDLHLAPGRYEMFCNMAGHYGGGMHATVLVQ